MTINLIGSGEGGPEPGLVTCWEGFASKCHNKSVPLKLQKVTEPVLPFSRMHALDVREKVTDSTISAEARIKAMMISINTMALQSQKIMEELTDTSRVQEQAREIEELKMSLHRWEEQVELKQKKIGILQKEKTDMQKELQEGNEKRAKEMGRFDRLRKKWGEEKTRLEKERREEAAKVEKMENLFNKCVMEEVLERIQSSREEGGMWVDKTKLQAFLLQTLDIIKGETEIAEACKPCKH